MAKRARIRDIEKWAQTYWADNKTFETNAPALDYSETNVDLKNRKKYFVTFPYPYMNGRIHLGHTFTMTKAEFAASYQRLLGNDTLYPMGFHCTGMPISTSADKLKYEIKTYGFPPDLEALRAELKAKAEEKAKAGNEPKIVDKSKSRKSKAAAKQGTGTQWEIMKEGFGLTDEETKAFTDPQHWIDYFPPHAINDLSNMGLKADWRRSFITTDRNPYYDSFVRWQFTNLKKNGRIARGMRNSIFSPKDGQPCMDHDRAKGEGVGPQEYVLIKMKVLEDIGFNKPTFLVAGTLRAETMYGQTNCWISPTIKYVAVETRKGEIWICTKLAAKNMSWQLKLVGEPGDFKVLREIVGTELFGKALKAPLTKYEKVYALPMMTIKEDMGTGVVTSCPSDSPMDYAALMDLKNKEALREKYDITEDMVLPYEPVPIIEVPGLGDLCAPTTCAQMKIASQNDAVKLAEAKEVCYLKGFYEGIMKVGKYAGQKVEDAKISVKNDLVASGDADTFHMPEKQVVSRSKDICVVALCDQWYLDYGDKSWKKETLEALDRCDTYCEETRKNFVYTINWLNEHACSRSYGLGSRLPWDEEWLIESLSDSTIYMAYYTCCHLLHSDLDGQTEPLVPVEQIDENFWNYVFHDSSLTNPEGIEKSKVSNQVMKQARAEFLHWYGVDMRVSGKDLVRNHLSYYLFNHVSSFPNTKEFQPKTIRANGHLLLNGEKMSKSTGNFLTLTEAIELFSADGMRLALADAGDGVDDANFEEDNANAAVLRLFTFLEYCETAIKGKSGEFHFRESPERNDNDAMFEAVLHDAMRKTKSAYDSVNFKEAVCCGVFELMAAKDTYKDICGRAGMNYDLIMKYIRFQILVLTPITPHSCEYLWQKVLKRDSSVCNALWPVIHAQNEQELSQIGQWKFVQTTARDMRLKYKSQLSAIEKRRAKGTKVDEPVHVNLYVSDTLPNWQQTAIDVIKSNLGPNGEWPEMKVISTALSPKQKPELKKFGKKMMPFVAMLKDNYLLEGKSALESTCNFVQEDILKLNKEYIRPVELESMSILSGINASENIRDEVAPGKPVPEFVHVPEVGKIRVRLTQLGSGVPSQDVVVRDNDCGDKILGRMRKMNKHLKNVGGIQLFRYKDAVLGPRSMPLPFRGDVQVWARESGLVEITTSISKVKDNLESDGKSLGEQIVCIIK